jgi:hypothetical protein
MALCRAWLKGVLSDEQRAAVLSLLAKHPSLDRLADGVADLLVHWWWADKSTDPSTQLLSEGEKIADRIWAVSGSEAQLSEEPTNGWLHEAINHPGGKVVQFWLYTLSLLRKHEGAKWSGMIPQVYRDRFTSVVTGTCRAAQLGRVLIASQVRFLFAVDPAWTKENVLPLLDFESNVQRAYSVWDGFLSWGSWDEGILPELLLLYERSFQHLLGAAHSKRDRLCEHLANIAVFSSINPLDSGWLGKFIAQADDTVRATWAAHVRQSLESLSTDRGVSLWERWLGRYWRRRNQGYPKPLGKAEVAAMVEWLPYLEGVFNAAVAEALKAPAPKYEYTSIYSKLLDRNSPDQHPKELTQLLLHLMPNIPNGFSLFCKDLEKLVKRLRPSSIPLEAAKRLCDELSRIGCANAANVLRSFQSAAGAARSSAPSGQRPDVFDLISQLPSGTRSKTDIDAQIELERESWERDK